MTLTKDINELKTILICNYITYGAAKLFNTRDTLKILRTVKNYNIDLRGILSMRQIDNSDLLCSDSEFEYNFIYDDLGEAIKNVSNIGEKYFFELVDIDDVMEYINRTYSH